MLIGPFINFLKFYFFVKWLLVIWLVGREYVSLWRQYNPGAQTSLPKKYVTTAVLGSITPNSLSSFYSITKWKYNNYKRLPSTCVMIFLKKKEIKPLRIRKKKDIHKNGILLQWKQTKSKNNHCNLLAHFQTGNIKTKSLLKTQPKLWLTT